MTDFEFNIETNYFISCSPYFDMENIPFFHKIWHENMHKILDSVCGNIVWFLKKNLNQQVMNGSETLLLWWRKQNRSELISMTDYLFLHKIIIMQKSVKWFQGRRRWRNACNQTIFDEGLSWMILIM